MKNLNAKMHYNLTLLSLVSPPSFPDLAALAVLGFSQTKNVEKLFDV